MAKAKSLFKRRKVAELPETLTLRFGEGHPLQGLEVEVRKRVPLSVVLSIAADEAPKALLAFARNVVGWNWATEDEEPIPFSVDALGELVSMDEFNLIVKAWMEVLTQPSAPLGVQ